MRGARAETSKGIVRARDRERRAMELRKAGATYEQIGDKLGITHAGARKALLRAIAKAASLGMESADELRRLEVERLDTLLLGLWSKARIGDVQAVDRVLRIAERRAKLLGLDAVVKAEITGRSGGPIEHDHKLSWVDVVRLAEKAREGED